MNNSRFPDNSTEASRLARGLVSSLFDASFENVFKTAAVDPESAESGLHCHVNDKLGVWLADIDPRRYRLDDVRDLRRDIIRLLSETNQLKEMLRGIPGLVYLMFSARHTFAGMRGDKCDDNGKIKESVYSRIMSFLNMLQSAGEGKIK